MSVALDLPGWTTASLIKGELFCCEFKKNRVLIKKHRVLTISRVTPAATAVINFEEYFDIDLDSISLDLKFSHFDSISISSFLKSEPFLKYFNAFS